MIPKRILLYLTEEDMSYIQYIKPLLTGHKVFFITNPAESVEEITLFAKSNKIKYIISTSATILNLVVDNVKRQSIDNWAGSLYEKNDIVYLFINPLAQIFTVSYGKFVLERYISKITKPEIWPRSPEFTWEIATPETIENLYKNFSDPNCILCSEDIETTSFENPLTQEYETIIDCVCYTGMWVAGNQVMIHSVILPISYADKDYLFFWISWMQKFNDLTVPKIFQNGLYDNGHMLATYEAPVRNYLFDTQSLFHAWYSELPKSLDAIAAFSIHNSYYWKDMAETGNFITRMEYNARDGWATLVSFVNLIREMPQWAINNYLIKFPLWPFCLYCNLEGTRINEQERQRLIEEYKTKFNSALTSLRYVLGDDFNPNSSQQVVRLMEFYGSADLKHSKEKELKIFAIRHPLNAVFAKQIQDVKDTAKIISTYLKPTDFSVALGKSKKEKSYLLKHNTLFYALNPDGTDTGRLACREGVFWTGSQVQNQPEETKSMWRADDGFILFEADNETSESYCTAYASGDPNLLATLLSGKDFHSVNAERFFGIPYNDIVEFKDGIKVVKNKKIRDLSKRTNHGATYDMQWFTLLNTMGEKLVDEAKILLALPKNYTRRRTCEYLLACFDRAYPTIQHEYYDAIVSIVSTIRMLTSPLGWTRYCFGNPKKSKREKDSLIAHVSQNMSVGVINEGCKKVFWEVAVPNAKNLRLKAQIHDSIFGQVRIGHEHLLKDVHKCLVRPTLVKDIVKGESRIMTIPVSLKIGPNWGNMKSIRVEDL